MPGPQSPDNNSREKKRLVEVYHELIAKLGGKKTKSCAFYFYPGADCRGKHFFFFCIDKQKFGTRTKGNQRTCLRIQYRASACEENLAQAGLCIVPLTTKKVVLFLTEDGRLNCADHETTAELIRKLAAQAFEPYTNSENTAQRWLSMPILRVLGINNRSESDTWNFWDEIYYHRYAKNPKIRQLFT